MLETTRDRELALITGRWGGPSDIRSAALTWFTTASIAEDAVLDANIHPLLQHAAEAAHGLDNFDAVPDFDSTQLNSYRPPAPITDGSAARIGDI